MSLHAFRETLSRVCSSRDPLRRHDSRCARQLVLCLWVESRAQCSTTRGAAQADRVMTSEYRESTPKSPSSRSTFMSYVDRSCASFRGVEHRYCVTETAADPPPSKIYLITYQHFHIVLIAPSLWNLCKCIYYLITYFTISL